MLTSIKSNSDYICQYLGQSKYSLICKHKKGLSKHEKDLSKHEKGLSELNHTKMYREYNLSQKDLHTGTVCTDIRNNTTRDSIQH